MHKHTDKCLDGCTHLATLNEMIVDTLICGYCKESKHTAKVERYSAGIYAGRMCDDCAYNRYRDHCGLDNTPQLTQADLDEIIEPGDYY